MIYDVPAIAELARHCAPEIATEAIVPLVLTESGGDALQININHGPRVRARSAAEGGAIVHRYVAAGYSVDIGLAQINSANLARLGVSPEQAFEPCANLRLASVVLRQGYNLATRYFAGLDAISATYSLYNTGTLTGGVRNGYVGRVWSTAVGLGSISTPPAAPVQATGGRSGAPITASRRDAEEWVVGQVRPEIVEVFR